MKQMVFLTLLCLMASVTALRAQKNVLNLGVAKELKAKGWHKNEIKSLINQNCIYTDSILKPKQFRQQSDWIDWQISEYVDTYESFQHKFPRVATNSPINDTAVDPRRSVTRERGKWKHLAMYATAGRIYDLELNPNDPLQIYANPDGDGIFKTKDGGLNWSAVTDNIPDRLHRNSHENVIVDPADFEHLFSISRFGQMYETTNGGTSWTKVENTEDEKGRSPQFKCVEAFRNSDNELVLFGTVTKERGSNSGWKKGAYRSIDSGRSWNRLDIEEKDFQEFVFHSQNHDILFLASKQKLFVSKNAGEAFEEIKDFKNGNRPIFITTGVGENKDAIYAVVSQDNNTQVFFSADCGASWELRQDSKAKIGYEKGIFGNSGSTGWTSFFAVDPFDINHLIASSVGSCESFDGGVTWKYFAWYQRANAQMADGTITKSPHASHNADNHVVKFHPKKKGLIIKGCDAGIMRRAEKDTNWVNINGNMPAFLWYSIVVNEFGDRYIAGNTQDVNIQTYRYGMWENDRGYEGDAIFMNPSTNTTYYPVSKTEKGEGLNFLEPGFWKMHSWSYPKVAVNYYNLDEIYIAYGRRPTEPKPQLPKYLYVTKDRGVSFTRVPNMNDKAVYSVNVSRTKEQVLTAFTEKDVMATIDQGENWTTHTYPDYFEGKMRRRKVSGCVDPQNPSHIWVGGHKGQVIESADGGETWSDIKYNLPAGDVVELLFHEGTGGDLYALVRGYGVFYKSPEMKEWKLWMDGFNLADFTEIRIDYPAQKLLASSYGRGAWQVDLEKSVDRFLGEALTIVQEESVNGYTAFKLDTELQLPAYYNYEWTLNGQSIGSNSSTLLVNKVEKGDQVSLQLSPIYSSDVLLKTSLIVEDAPKGAKEKLTEESYFLKDNYIDAGYVDLFNSGQNFTIAANIKPITEGVIASNRRTYYRDAKGWYLEVTKSGALHFNVAFKQNQSLDKTLEGGLDQALTIKSKDSLITFNQWSNISVSVDRHSTVKIYLNGNVVAEKDIKGYDNSLNHVMPLTILADTYGKRRMIAEIKEFVIYSNAMSSQEAPFLKRMKKIAPTFYINFANKSKSKELFTNRTIKLK